MGLNLGSFAGGLAAGVSNGLEQGQKIFDMKSKGDIARLQQQGMDEAARLRNAAVDGRIQTGTPASIVSQAGLPPLATSSGDDSPFITDQQASQLAAQANQQQPTTLPTAGNPAGQQAATGDDSPYLTDAQASQIAAQANQQPATSNPAPAAQPMQSGNVGAAVKEPPAVPPGQGGLGDAPVKPAAAAGLPNAQTATQPGDATQKATAIATATAADAATQAQPQAQPTATGATVYTVDGKQYNSYDEAHKAAEAQAPSVMDYFMKNGAPLIEQEYLKQGDVDKAKAWRSYMDDQTTRQHLNEWSSAWRMASLGNYDKAADHIFNLYKQYDDGFTPVSKEVVKDKDGNTTGFNVRVKNDKTGEETTQFINKDNLIQVGLTALAPPQMFEKAYEGQLTANKYAMQMALEDKKDQRSLKQALGVATIRGQYELASGQAQAQGRIGAAVGGAQMRNQAPGTVGKTIADLQSWGWTKPQIDAYLQSIGAGSSSALGKAPHPDTIALHVMTALSHDPNARYQNSSGKMVAWGKLSPAEKQNEISRGVQQIQSAGSGSAPASTAAPAAVAGLPPMPAAGTNGGTGPSIGGVSLNPGTGSTTTRKIYNVRTGRIEDQ